MALSRLISYHKFIARISANTAQVPIQNNLYSSRRRSRFLAQVLQNASMTCCVDLFSVANVIFVQTGAVTEQGPMPLTKDQQLTWDKVIQTYNKAQESGAAAKYKTHTQIVTDPRLSLNFVLRVSDSLRDKPKPPKSR